MNVTLKEIDRVRKSGFRPQVVGCIVNEGRLLFVCSKKHDLWQLPQGGIDNKETLEEAFWREMREELGDRNISREEKELRIIGSDIVKFPRATHNSKDLQTDAGEKVYMKGKKYYFMAVEVDNKSFDDNSSDFDEHQWVDYERGKELTKKIYQQGKRRVIDRVLGRLQGQKLLRD